jgi:hypothetical protein
MVIRVAGQRIKAVADVLERLEQSAAKQKLYLAKIWHFFGDALHYYQEGFDFVIHYEPEGGHKENEWGDLDSQTAIEQGLFHPSDSPQGPAYGYDWVVDSPERLEIYKGAPLGPPRASTYSTRGTNPQSG